MWWEDAPSKTAVRWRCRLCRLGCRTRSVQVRNYLRYVIIILLCQVIYGPAMYMCVRVGLAT